MSLPEWKDPGLGIADLAFLLDEDLNQREKWGIQVRTPFEWLAYLVEEVGELAEAISEAHYRGGAIEKIALEAIQASTLALKIAKMSQK